MLTKQINFENKKEVDLHLSELQTYSSEFQELLEDVGYNFLSSLICEPVIKNSILPNDINEIKTTYSELSGYINSKNAYEKVAIEYDLEKLKENCSILNEYSKTLRKLYIDLLSNYEVATKFKRLKQLQDDTTAQISETTKLIRKLNSLKELIKIVDTLVNINYKIEYNLLTSQMNSLKEEIESNTKEELSRLSYAYERLSIYSRGISLNMSKIYYKTILDETISKIDENELPELFKDIILELKEKMINALEVSNTELETYIIEINELKDSFILAYQNLSYPRPRSQIELLKKIVSDLSKINN